MTVLGELASTLSRGMDIVEEAVGKTASEIASLGVPDALAIDLAALAEPFAPSNSFQRLRRETMERGRAHSLTTLLAVEKQARKLRTEAERWRVRHTALATAGDTRDVEKKARELVAARSPRRERKPGIRFAQHPDGQATLTICGPSADLTDMRDSLDCSSAESALAGLKQRWFGEGNPSQPTISVMLVTNMENYARALEGHEVWFQLSNGALISSTELATRNILDHGFHVLMHPVHGPVNLHRVSRFASTKQRLMATAENPRCAWLGCKKGANDCQVHHLKAWRHGGETSAENLTMACQYHNAVNDDETAGGRGWLERHGTVYWVPPSGWYIPPWTDKSPPPLNSPLPDWLEEERTYLDEELSNFSEHAT